jgi:hypothetical protein
MMMLNVSRFMVLCTTLLFSVAVLPGQSKEGPDASGGSSDFKGKVVVAGSGPQIETSIDMIADALTTSGVPVKVIAESIFRRAAN